MENCNDNNGRFQKGMKRSEESKKNQSETLKRQHANGERKTWSEGKTKATDPRLAAAAEKKKGKTPWTEGKKAKDYPDWDKAVKEAAAKRKASGYGMPDSGKEKLSDYWKARPEECRERRRNQKVKRIDTEIELLMQEAFRKLGVLLQTNKRLRGASGQRYQADIVIESWLNVECDGQYWHSPVQRPLQVEHDAKRDADLRKNGYQVIRLKEKEIRRDPMAQALKIRDVLKVQPDNGTDTSQSSGDTENHTSDN